MADRGAITLAEGAAGPAGASPPVRRESRLRRPGPLVVGRLLVPVVVLGIWEVSSTRSELIPSIGSTVESLADAFATKDLASSLVDSMQAVGGGFLIAAVVGVALGILLGSSRRLAAVVEPLVTAAFAVPRIVLYPVLLAAFGVGLSAKLWMAVLSAVFPILLNTAAGVRDVDPTLVKLGRSVGCSGLSMARRIYAPAAAPAIMVGIRLGFSVAFISVIIAELFAAAEGLGLVIQQAYAFQDYATMFGVVLLVTAIAFGANLVLWILERRLHAAVS
jgi:NitT/TauT family transport system permease protein